MRVNRPLEPRHPPFLARAVGAVPPQPEAHPPARLPGAQRGLLFGGPAIVQYWRTFADLERYARAADAEHLPAWRRFNQLVRDSGDVGIWHETYKVRAGEYEAIYGNASFPRIQAKFQAFGTLLRP